ncbi:hypothetical protein [Priestia megaterium]|uniref:hypothetical protein n=1 Tax=Priestia megaterium TaxID=1404 RepID=UPI0020400810|nr:hypothetical protein [Priestia megaterium]MCM3796814.1 hypothetical protein [Priestia megaterium]WJD83852.1 hypothetical protein QRD24_28550 [Priestia megaterium]
MNEGLLYKISFYIGEEQFIRDINLFNIQKIIVHKIIFRGQYKKIIIFLSIAYLVILTACNQESTGTDKGSSAVIVVVQNNKYNGTEDKLDKSKEIGEQIGTVEKKTKANDV